ncbi:2-oxoglutarate receptor 1 [Xenentodon cancila]
MDVMLIEPIIRALMFIAGILGNIWLVIVSLPKRKSGFRTKKVLFINLAVSNLLTNYLVNIPDTMVDFAGRWFLGETFCAIFRFCAEFSETSSIFTTFFISAFWHQKLVGSLKRGGAPVQLDSMRLVGCLLAGSWTVAAVFSIPYFFYVSVVTTNDSHEDCINVFPNELTKQTYETIYLIVANGFPLTGILFASVRIVVTLIKNQRRIGNHNSHPAKELVKENRSLQNKTGNGSISIVSSPGTSKKLEDPPSRVSTGQRSYSTANAGLAGKTSQASSQNRKTDTDCKNGAKQNLSRPSQVPSKEGPNSGTQARAAKSVVAVASVVLVCWLTHLALSITNNIQTSSIVVIVVSYSAASYTCIIPYILLHGVKKLTCSCKR